MVHEEGTTHCKGPYRGWYPKYTLLNLSQGDSHSTNFFPATAELVCQAFNVTQKKVICTM